MVGTYIFVTYLLHLLAFLCVRGGSFFVRITGPYLVGFGKAIIVMLFVVSPRRPPSLLPSSLHGTLSMPHISTSIRSVSISMRPVAISVTPVSALGGTMPCVDERPVSCFAGTSFLFCLHNCNTEGKVYHWKHKLSQTRMRTEEASKRFAQFLSGDTTLHTHMHTHAHTCTV